jgi:hypothetical protein
VREDEIPIEIDALLVVTTRLGELPLYKVQLRSVVENIGIVRILLECLLKVFFCFLGVA